MQPLNVVERVIALEGVELLKSLSPDQLSVIAYVAQQVEVPAGQDILTPTTSPDGLYVILDGTVELQAGGQALDVARQNDVLGSWALFDDTPLNVRARAIEETSLLKISRDDFFELLSDNTEIASALFSTLARRFRALLESIRPQG